MTTAPQKYPEQETDNNKHVDVSDILHLVREANEKGYIKTSNQFEKPKAEFKKRTLRDIAESNMTTLKEKQTVDADISATTEAQPSQHEQPDASTDQVDNQMPDDDADIPMDQPDQQITDQKDDEPFDSPDAVESDQDQPDKNQEAITAPEKNAAQDLGDTVPDISDMPETTETDTATDGFKTTLTPASQDTASPADTANYDRGFAEGKAAALAEIDENISSAIASFTTVTEAISKEDSIDLAQLEKAMFGAINQLASERAGIEIDAHPAPFTAKVASMVSRIRNRIDEPVIHLHPHDIAAIQPQLEKQLAPRNFTLTADEMMKRGDARVDVGSIGVMDLIDDQPGKAAPAPKKTKMQSDMPAKAESEAKDNDHE